MDEFATPEHEEDLSHPSGSASSQEGEARSDSPERLSEANAAGSPLIDGAAAAGARSSNTHLLGSQRVKRREEQAPLVRLCYDQMLLREEDYSGPLENAELQPGAVAAVDWLEESSSTARR